MPELTRCTPYFEVFDMTQSLGFYRDGLGFEVLFASPEVQTREGRFSHFVHLGRGGVRLMLNTAHDSNERPPERPAPRDGVHLYIDCDDVDAVHAEVVARGVRAGAPDLTGYGWRAFSVQDPDGYRVIFQQPISK